MKTKKNVIKKQSDMKILKLLTITMLCSSISITADAQEHLASAFNNFVNDKNLAEYITSSTQVNKSGSSTKPTSFSYIYKFDLPSNKRKALNQVIAAFNQDRDSAYSVFTKSAGIEPQSEVNVAYGENLEERIIFGSHIEKNYMTMLTTDPNDSLRRYVYGIVWQVDSTNNHICGSLHKIYSLDPARRNEQTDFNKAIRLDTDGNIYFYNKGKRINVPFKWDGRGNMVTPDKERTININALVDNIKTDSIMTKDEFLNKFSIIRSTYVKMPHTIGGIDSSLNTALVNKMVQLCSQYSSLLDKDEKDLCIKGLKEMQKYSTDKYLEGRLDIAIKKIK